MPRKKKEEDNFISAGAESKPKPRILPSLQNLFQPGKARAKRLSDEGIHVRQPDTVGALPRNSGAPLPSGHHSPSTHPVMGSSLPVSQNVSARQISTSVSAFLPTLRAFLPSSTNRSSISATDPCASSQRSTANVPSSGGDQTQLYSSCLSYQHNPAPATPENADSKSRTFAKRGIACLRIVGEVVGVSTESMEKEISRHGAIRDHCGILAKSVKDLMVSNIPQAMRSSLENLRSKLDRMATEDNHNVEDAQWKVTNYLQVFLLENLVTGCIPPDELEKMENQLSVILDKVMGDALQQSITILPCANAAYNDYTETQRRVSCYKGTRQALLEEVIAWLSDPNSNIYVLFGLAGIGKSTIAQTVAETADKIHLLGASFFFSRDEQERRTAKVFFTTIASQLCVYDPEFAKAIEGALSTEKGKSAIRKLPMEQLETLILEPLRKLTPRNVVVVVDALDECGDDDAPTIITGLNKLVQSLPSFRVVLTTRPQPHLQFLLGGQTFQNIFHLHNIEEKIVDSDIELYLRHHLAWEQVRIRLPTLTNPWAASDEDIQTLVHAAGRLFIIASTAVLFILDRTSTPSFRMKMLRVMLDQDHTPFNTLNNFYTTILRNAVPTGCEYDTVNRYQMVLGAIILMQQPVPISTLAMLTDIEVNDITVVLGNLQPVILLGNNNTPVVYHKSFPDYVQDSARCKDVDLRIDPTFHHTRMAIYCLRLLNQCLKRNIMDLCDAAQFMDNDDALKNQGLTETHVQEKVPTELRYACLYFVNHIETANIEDTVLVDEVEQFFNERFIYWLEALSWIRELDSAHRALPILRKKLTRCSSDLCQLVDDGLRFVWNFHDLIRRSALHTYHSALPFTPTESSLYKTYSKQMTFCRVQGGQKMWDGLISAVNYGCRDEVNNIIFSTDSALLACFKGNHMVTIHEAVSGKPLGKIEGQVLAIANDFSKAAAFNDGSITLYNIKDVTPVATIKPSAAVVELALSHGSRLLAGLNNGTIDLWDIETCEQIGSFGDWKKLEKTEISFSSDGSRVAFASCEGVVKLLDGINGKVIADLAFLRMEDVANLPFIKRMPLLLKFSGDGSLLACLDSVSLTIWNGRDGALIGTAEDVRIRLFAHGPAVMAISTDGSLLATGQERQMKLWNGNDLALLETVDLNFDYWIMFLAIQNDLIGIVSMQFIALYDINKRGFIALLPFQSPTVLAFSPDCTRLAAGTSNGDVQLWRVSSVTTTDIKPQEEHATSLAFSSDCSRLASGHWDGTIRLWDTSNMVQLAVQKGHSWPVKALAYNLNVDDGGEFASGSLDGTIRLWNGKDGTPSGELECLVGVERVALSSNVLAAATHDSITLWDLKTRFLIATLDQKHSDFLAFPHYHSLLAAVNMVPAREGPSESKLMVWDAIEHAPATTSNPGINASEMRVLPNEPLAIRTRDGRFYLFDPRDSRLSQVAENHATSLGLRQSWHGIPVWFDLSLPGLVGRFPQQEEAVQVLICPRGLFIRLVAEGSSMIALGRSDGHILLIQAI